MKNEPISTLSDEQPPHHDGKRHRFVDQRVAAALAKREIVLLYGPRGCGKRQLALGLCDQTYRFDGVAGHDESGLRSVLERASTPVCVDGWQGDPQRWEALVQVARAIGRPGQVVTTFDGSLLANRSYSPHVKEAAHVEAGPLSSVETGLSDGALSLGRLLGTAGDTDRREYPTLASNRTDRQLASALVRGGWPLAAPDDRGEYARRLWADLMGIDREDGEDEHQERLLFGRAIVANLDVPLTDLAVCGSVANRPTDRQRERFSALQQELLDSLALTLRVNWRPTKLLESRFSPLPRRLFCDPSLAAAAMGLGVESLVGDSRAAGRLFRNLAIRDLTAYAAANGMAAFHYNDKDGAAIDLVLEGRGFWSAMAVALDPASVPLAAQDLARTVRYLTAYRLPEPRVMAVIAGPGSRSAAIDGVRVLPFDRLGV